jgi:hypothetical protein
MCTDRGQHNKSAAMVGHDYASKVASGEECDVGRTRRGEENATWEREDATWGGVGGI